MRKFLFALAALAPLAGCGIDPAVRASELDNDICSLCANNGTDECEGCDIRQACPNYFELDEKRITINEEE